MSYRELVDQIEKDKIEELKQRLNFVLRYLREGMSIHDSLTMSEVSYEEFEKHKEDNPRFAQLVERKMAEYKHEVVQAINEGLKNKDPRLGLIIAEAKYPEEYSKKRRQEDPGKNSITNVINLIQNGEHGEQVLPKSEKKRERIVEAAFEPESPQDFINPPKQDNED